MISFLTWSNASSAYMLHERETLERVIAARDQAAAELRQATEQAGNAEALQKWMGAEGTLAGARSAVGGDGELSRAESKRGGGRFD